MKIQVTIPDKKEVIKSGVPVCTAKQGTPWLENCINPFSKERGVYIIHYDGIIKYIGKTRGRSMSFGMRLRRHFQEKAEGKHTYPRLAKLGPSKILVSFFTSKEIAKWVSHTKICDEIKLIDLFEAALILEWDPEFQRDEEVIRK